MITGKTAPAMWAGQHNITNNIILQFLQSNQIMTDKMKSFYA